MTTKATRGRPCRFTDEQMADIAYAYYTADKGKESKEQILSEHGISIAQFYKNMKKLDVKFFVQIGNGQIVEATGF
ncbi:hypothetical protein LXQ17_002648 [Escherichia coli]|uniref:hypothetical protein n=1 Tax=Escherichia coli TaxID=562 RepID=UPI0010AB7587|nr:hypothetical protein [Escherichia coli]EEQ2380549.1 hypothetical protein [Escherichia coli]EER8222243.1 hypothetical protein [Escherichia coli]EES3439738.1 hypothetical protein [Escherichia coli]EEW3151983.1 hypothetical protein [Escherichia coli]EEY6511559.1 hypothetical protein [Escherichia coli]